MSKNSGYLVTYTNKDGKQQKAIARHTDQRKEFGDRFCLRLCDDNFNLLKNEKGGDIIILKNKKLLELAGFVD